MRFADSSAATVVYLERYTSDLYLEKPSDAQHYSLLHDHLPAQALSPDSSRDFITGATKTYIDTANHP
ncbi:Scr1 family TA system antitoxin-like transcriptional regulator [Streptomyces sp. NPDC058301]|uniref:Scr1 family TA system antitoxin-like transcriptional regulator n=1 Tax=Streptomyces sp. NPDC058301 TaxID=3346436 RepID=UPI0036ED69F2